MKLNNATTQPKKRFGQNFLKDHYILEKITKAIAPQKDQHLIEIGPGLGALTLELLPLVNTLDVIELDRDVIPELLKKTIKYSHILHVHEADILQFDFKPLYADNIPLRIVGNLPYNISSPILFHLIEFINIIKDIHIMLQREVAERIIASPNCKEYGRLSVMVQYYCQGELLFDVYPHSFFPEPKVDSSFVRLVPISKKVVLAKNFILFENIVREAFNHRRKTIRNSLKNIVSEANFDMVGVNPNLRPEQLSVDDFVRISNSMIREINE